MQHFKYHPEIFNQPVRLSDENPYEVIRDFFLNYRLSEIRQMLWDMVETSLTSRDTVFDGGLERGNLLYFYSQVEGCSR